MSRFNTSARLLAVVVIAGAAGSLPGPAAAVATTPDASVQIERFAREGPRDTILASLRAQCAPGFEFAELVVDFSQGDVVTPSLLGQAIPCDGRWHDQDITSLEAFEPGTATMATRLSVTNEATGEPGVQGVDSETIRVRAAAAVELGARGRLHSDGSATIRVVARCDRPWVEANLGVGASQFRDDGTSVAAFVSLPTGTPVCDDRWHSFSVRATPAGGLFHAGVLEVSADLSILDPDFFDPVTQASTSRTVTI